MLLCAVIGEASGAKVSNDVAACRVSGGGALPRIVGRRRKSRKRDLDTRTIGVGKQGRPLALRHLRMKVRFRKPSGISLQRHGQRVSADLPDHVIGPTRQGARRVAHAVV